MILHNIQAVIREGLRAGFMAEPAGMPEVMQGLITRDFTTRYDHNLCVSLNHWGLPATKSTSRTYLFQIFLQAKVCPFHCNDLIFEQRKGRAAIKG
jgi:hypothetical protein